MGNRLNAYLKDVERKLKPLPRTEREDILKEIESQILELSHAGKSEAEILDRLGDSRLLAKAYLSDLIAKDTTFRPHKILALCAYYTLAGFSGIVIIPTLAICAPVFLFCSVATPLLLFAKMADHFLNLNIPYLQHVGLFSDLFQVHPFIEFVCSIPICILLYFLGCGCWKLLIRYVKGISAVRKRFSD